MSEFEILRVADSPIGGIEVIAGENGVRQVNLLGSHFHGSLVTTEGNHLNFAALQVAQLALQEIQEYLQKKRTRFDILIDWSQIKFFQKKVLEAACGLSFGEVCTYGSLAKKLGQASASRAVGGALARNPMPILIPCHRVVASNGLLTGFSAADGIRTKQLLLELEGRAVVNQKLV